MSFDGPCIGGPLDGQWLSHYSQSKEVIYFNGFERGADGVARTATVSKFYHWHGDRWVLDVVANYKDSREAIR
jgi:hypothetical protein